MGSYKPGDVIPLQSYAYAGTGLVLGRVGAFVSNPGEFSWWLTFAMFAGVFGFLFIVDLFVQLYARRALSKAGEEQAAVRERVVRKHVWRQNKRDTYLH